MLVDVQVGTTSVADGVIVNVGVTVRVGVVAAVIVGVDNDDVGVGAGVDGVGEII